MIKFYALNRIVSFIMQISILLFASILLFLSWRQALQVFLILLLLIFLTRKSFKLNSIIFIIFLVVFLFSIISDITAQFYLRKAELLYSNNDLEQSLNYYKRAVAINPRNQLYRIRLADYYVNMGDYRRAISQYLIAERHSPGDTIIKMRLISAYINLRQLQEAAGVYNKVKKMARFESLTYDEKCRLIDLNKQLLYGKYSEKGLAVEAEKIRNNLVRNGDFSLSLKEDNMPDGWVKCSLNLKTFLLNDLDNKHIFKITNWHNNDTVQSYPIEIKNDAIYNLTFLIKINVRSGGLYLQWNAFTDNPVAEYGTLASFHSDISEWKMISLKIDPSIFPGNTKYINLLFKWYEGRDYDCGTAYIKDVYLTKADNV